MAKPKDSLPGESGAQVTDEGKVLEDLRAENDRLRLRISELENDLASGGLEPGVAKLVEEKVRAGLPRRDAIEVAMRQMAVDTAAAAEKAKSNSQNKTT